MADRAADAVNTTLWPIILVVGVIMTLQPAMSGGCALRRGPRRNNGALSNVVLAVAGAAYRFVQQGLRARCRMLFAAAGCLLVMACRRSVVRRLDLVLLGRAG